jgi:hypothetical protein
VNLVPVTYKGGIYRHDEIIHDSVELVSAQQEYLSSVRALAKSDPASDPADSFAFKGLESAAREKLRLFDISDAQIDRLRGSGKARAVPLAGDWLARAANSRALPAPM